MKLGPSLDLRTSQTLVLSPQLQAAIRLLTLSNLELQAEINVELERNPLLDLADEDGGIPGGPDDTSAATSIDNAPDSTAPADAEINPENLIGDHSSDLDVDFAEERFHHDCAVDSGNGNGSSDDFSLDHVAGELPTLIEILERQAAGLPAFEQAVALAIISCINEAGYLIDPLNEIAERIGIESEEAERILTIVQTFEPTGVGARTLAECIALQAKEADRYDPCMAALIDNLDLVARGDLARLRRLCDVDAEDLADMLRELRSYNPKPGLVYGGTSSQCIVPDVFVRRTRKGWIAELNNATLPRLIFNREYRVEIADRNTSHTNEKAEKQFLDQCVQQANWLIRALDQRATTILKVVTALIERQQGFFEHGVQQLKPMTLRSVADEIGMHESTVSRVTSHKYLSCDRGLFELKYFFTAAIPSGDGDEASAEAVRAQLKALIDAEPPLKPFSDDKLVELLKQEGFALARRTVAKYREAMQIPSSFDRRRRALVQSA
ncbi:MAG: RNA polymerase factor sigma-54 [Sphingomonadaceae bacterium]